MSEVQTALNSVISPKDPVDRVYKTTQIAQPPTQILSIRYGLHPCLESWTGRGSQPGRRALRQLRRLLCRSV